MSNHNTPRYYNEVSVGDSLEPAVFEVTQEKARKYLEAVQDKTPFYLDAKRAREVSLEGMVAPPTLAVLCCRLFPSPPGTVHVGQEFEFIKAMKVGDTIFASGNITAKFEKKGKKFISYNIEGKNQSSEAVFKASATLILPA